MIRLSTPHRNPGLTGRILSALATKHGSDVQVSCFGSPTEALLKSGILLNGLTNYGNLRRDEVAMLLGQTDIFLDLSSWQAMGLTAMEAMASGSSVIVPQAGGAKEISIHGISGIHVDTSNASQCLRAADTLILNHDLRLLMRANAIDEVSLFAPENAALEILKVLLP
jgi:glycosyltransferase involved in cell wall biosynthesis